jgi:hypothetical protein
MLVEKSENEVFLQPAFQPAPPSAVALVESLRGVGYSAATAVADIIDNSISAGAKNVWLDFRWDPQHPWIAILDDGDGMGEAELFEAMQLGGKGPLETRAATDLGRFGLGLKTASFALCRRLTVASRRDGQTVTRRWDLDHILHQSRDWHLLIGAAPGSEKLLVPLDLLDHGTLVIWQVLDRFSGADESRNSLSQNAFLETIDRVEDHLAMVFHRYLEGTAPALRIYLNGKDETHRVRPWDPFLTDHPATMRTPVERIPTRGGLVEIQGFTLPHKDQLTKEQFERAAGPDGWTAQQGFYVYRNRRLLVAGSWLGLGTGKLWTKEEAHKLARLRLDLPNSADDEWRIDIKKSTARPPQYIRPRLRTLAEDARQLAREVFAHRGNYGARAPIQELSRVWKAQEGTSGVRYRLDRDHPAIQQVVRLSGDQADAVEAMLRIIEETVPVQRIWLDTVEKGEVQPAGFSGEGQAEIKRLLEVMYRHLRGRVGLSSEQARIRLLRTEPFQQYRELVDQLAD